MDEVSKAANNPELKQLLNSTIQDYKLVENMIDSGRTTRKTKTKKNFKYKFS